ncbi:bacteriohemerythrin [Burkholderia sp. MR1-5-21]
MKESEDNGTTCSSPPEMPMTAVAFPDAEPAGRTGVNGPVSRGFAWDDDYALGHLSMDDAHHEFVDCVNTLLTVADEHLERALEAFADHARRHFGDEDDAMRSTAYESAGCHIDEHAAVLRSIDEVRDALAAGRPSVVRSFARALADWFPEHVRVMDLGLSRWLVQQQLGAAPVVIRRRPHRAA